MDLAPGDKVEALMDWQNRLDGAIKAGAAYVLTEVWPYEAHWGACPCHAKTGQNGVFVAGLRRGERAWCSLLFRKRPPEREALFRSLLEPIDVKEDA